MMDNFIKKYGSYLLPIAVGALALYDRFIVIELENELNKKDFQRQIEHIKKDLKNELRYVVLVVFAIWFGYDGYHNEKFKDKHTDANGTPDSTLVFNRKSPPIFIGAAVLLGAYLFAIRNKKVIADENELIISDKERISCDSIQKIDKTRFDSKGYFLITYKNKSGNEVNRKLSNRTYDNLEAILEHLVAKIS